MVLRLAFITPLIKAMMQVIDFIVDSLCWW